MMKKLYSYCYTTLLMLVAVCFQAAAGGITFIIEKLPDYHPKTEPVYLASNLNSWNTANHRYRFELNDKGQLQLSVPMKKVGDKIQFKLTRGSWDNVELDANQYNIQNRTYEYRGHSYNEYLTIAHWQDYVGSKGNRTTATGHIEILKRKLKYKGVYRTVRVWLPPQYKTKPKQDFAVLYMFDGQNLFDSATASVGMEWRIDELIAKRAQQDANKALIVVGVDAAQQCRRFVEYTAWQWRTKECGGIEGEGAYFSAFLVNEVRPYIEAHYRVKKHRDYRYLGGSSLGGYMAVYTSISYQHTFSKVFGLSNAVIDEYTGDKLRDYIREVKRQNKIQFYLDIGDQEAVTQSNNSEYLINGNKLLVGALVQAGFERGNIKFSVIRGGVHDEHSWSERMPAIMDWLNLDSAVNRVAAP